MLEELETTSTEPDPETDPQTQEEGPPESALSAIRFSRDAYNDAYEEYRDSNGGSAKVSEYLCKMAAVEAYRDSLPVLSSRQDILNFIACVAEGVLLEAIPENTSSKLIYAAYAALRALPREPKPQKTKKRHPRGAKKVNRGQAEVIPSKQAA